MSPFYPSKKQIEALVVLRAALVLCEEADVRIDTDLDHISIEIGKRYPEQHVLNVTRVDVGVINEYFANHGIQL